MRFRPIQHCIEAAKKLPIDDLAVRCATSDRMVVVLANKLRELGVNVEELLFIEAEIQSSILKASNKAGRLLEELTNQETIERN